MSVTQPSPASESRCGLIGAFPGDDSTFATLSALRSRLLMDAAPISTSEVRALLCALPWSGRVEFCAKSLYPPAAAPTVQARNSALILQLFRECFESITAMASAPATKTATATAPAAEAAADDEWEIVSVSLASETKTAAPAGAASSSSGAAPALLFLKSSEYSVLRALVSSLSSLGPISVTLFEEYFARTTSTVFRSPFVSAMVALSPSLFSDARLESVYRSAVESMRREMEKQCRELAGARAGFITRLLQAGLIPDATEYIHFATAAALESQLIKAVEVISEPATPVAPVLRVAGGASWSWSLNWSLHSEVYLRFLSTHLAAHSADPIWCGRFLTEFTACLKPARLPPAVGLAIFKLYGQHAPLQINQALMPAGVREHIAEMSRKGQLVQQGGAAPVEYAGLTRLFPPMLIRRSVSAEDRWSMLQSHLVRGPEGLSFAPLQFELCQSILADLARKDDYREPISKLTVQMIEALSPKEAYRLIFAPASAGSAADGSTAQASPLLTLTPFLALMFPSKDIRLSHPVRNAWAAMHLAQTPPALASTSTASAVDAALQASPIKDFVAGRNMDALWKAWMESFRAKLTPTLTQMAQKAQQAIAQSSVRCTRSAVTSYVGYCAILARECLRVFQCAKDVAAPVDILGSILAVVETFAPLTDDSAIVALYPAVQPQSVAEDAPGVKSIRALRSACDELVLAAVSVLRARAFDFDLMSPKYGTLAVHIVQSLLTRLSSAANLERFPSLAAALFAFYRATLDATVIPDSIDRLGFVLVSPTDAERAQGNAKTKWNFVNRSYHQVCRTLMMDQMSQLCTVAAAATKKGSANAPALVAIAEQAWTIVRPRYFPVPAAASSSSSSSSSSSADSDAAKLLELPVFNAFLSACAALPTVISAREKPLLLTALVHHLRAPDSRFNAATVPGVAQWEGWTAFLLQAVDQCGAEWPSRGALLSSIGDISLPAVRECMQAACSDRDPQTRLQQYLSILRMSAASPSLHEWALSLEFVQKRTKNEAGLYRKEIYQLINEQIAAKVAQSLGRDVPPASAAAAAVVSGPSALSSVELITACLSSILRDDVSKRDSVAKNQFQNIGRTILTQAVSMVRPPQLAVRRLWISCGIALDWLVLRTISGEDAIRRWVWPIAGISVSSKHSITEAQLEGPIKAAVTTGVKGGENVFSALRQTVYRSGMHVHVAPQDVFTPEQAVELLTSSFLAQQTEDKAAAGSSASSAADSNARPFDYLVESSSFFPSAEAEGGRRAASAADAAAYDSLTLKRVQQLVAFCGKQWTAVPALVRFFEQVVSTVAEPRHASHPLFAAHFKQTYALFEAVRKLYPDASAWYELPPLARACTVLFKAAIDRSNIAAANALRPVWTEMKMFEGKISAMKLLSLPERGWLVANLVPLRGRHALPLDASVPKPARMAADKADSSDRSAVVLRDLLALTPSAFHQVWPQLLAARDDIFSNYLGRTRTQLFGIFDSAATLDAASNQLQPSFDAAQGAVEFCPPMQSKDVSSLNPRAMQTFTRLCLRDAMNQSLSATVRAAQITQFVESPATSHADVIALLRDLQARVAFKIKSEKKGGAAAAGAAAAEEKKDESLSPAAAVVDDAADLLLESVILRVFSTDGTWFVLAYLLSPDVISGSPQRTTASILTNLRLWAPIDRTVSVLRILLEPRRRRAISLFLHKQILRLLFECMDANEQARQLFQAEWSQRNAADTRMAADVTHEVIRMCVSALNGGSNSSSSAEKSALAWSVVEDLVEDSATREIDPATLLLLFVTWQPASPALDSSGQLASNASSLGALIRSVQPPQQWVAGVQDPSSFGAFHSKLIAEPAVYVTFGGDSAASMQTCKRFAGLMHKLSTVTKHPYLRVLSRLQQFAFSVSMTGLPDDAAIQQIERLLLEVSTVESVAQPASSSAASLYVGVELDSVSVYSLEVLPRLFAGLSLQVLTRAWLEACKADPQSSFVQFCKEQPCAVRLRESIGTLLHTLLNTPPIQAARRIRASSAVRSLLSQVQQTAVPQSSAATAARRTTPSPSWSLELFQVPFKEQLNYLRKDGAVSAALPQGVERAE